MSPHQREQEEMTRQIYVRLCSDYLVALSNVETPQDGTLQRLFTAAALAAKYYFDDLGKPP